jgi:hypothetical protein
MQIIQQLMKDGTVFCPPFQYQQGTMDLVWCRLSGAATERLVTVDGRAQFGGLVHGEALMLTEDMTPDTAALRREWFAVLLSPEPIRGDSLHARMVVCATRDEALRLAGAIQSGDRRARGYQPGGPALSPTLDLPREIPPFDLAGFLPLPALAPLRDGWDNLLPVPRLEANGNAFVGCVSERQARAVHARANAAGLTKTELYALCRVAFRVADVPHLRSSAFRWMMDTELPKACKPGRDLAPPPPRADRHIRAAVEDIERIASAARRKLDPQFVTTYRPVAAGRSCGTCGSPNGKCACF